MNWAFIVENMRRTFIAFDKFDDCSVLMRLPTMAGMRHAGLITRDGRKQVTKVLLTPAMLWQIPRGPYAYSEEASVKSALRTFASGGNLFMGDARIGSDPDTPSLQLNTVSNKRDLRRPDRRRLFT